MRIRFTTTLLILAAVAGCASTGSTGTRDRDLISYEEVEGSDQANAYDIVRTLRPAWLRVRGPSSFNAETPIQVYVDGTRLGGPETLQSIPRLNIQEIRHYDPMEAQSRWGLNHTNGAIQVITRRGG